MSALSCFLIFSLGMCMSWRPLHSVARVWVNSMSSKPQRPAPLGSSLLTGWQCWVLTLSLWPGPPLVRIHLKSHPILQEKMKYKYKCECHITMLFLYRRNSSSFTALTHKFDLKEHICTTYKTFKYLVVQRSVHGTLELLSTAKGFK